MNTVFIDITVIICLATILLFIFRLFHQPSILAYILTGVLLGPIGLFHIQSTSDLQLFGYVGITLLLFMLGLELRLKDLVSIGKVAVIVGLLQVWFTFILSFFISRLVGYSTVSSFFIGIAVSISSTVILVRLFSEKKALNSLHGKLALGISLVQDLVAILLLIFLSDSHFSFLPDKIAIDGGILLIKIVILFTGILILSYKVFPLFTSIIAKSAESLFLFSLSWVFLLTAILSLPVIGFSPEIGGFLAGLALANTNEAYQIVGRMKPLRDFFITIFFVMLGLQMTFTHIINLLPGILLLSLLAMVVKPAIILLLMSAYGFRKRTSFLVGVSLGQISEFSLLVVFLVTSMHYLSQDVITTIILAGLVSFVFSTYALSNSNNLYKLVQSKIDFLETDHVHHLQNEIEFDTQQMKNHLVIIGGHQMGMSILESLGKENKSVLVIDFDPDIIHKLRERNVTCFYGDISDPEIQERARLDSAKLVISTVPDVEDNLLLIERLNRKNKKAKIVVMTYEISDAKRLYAAGADYVVLPHLAGGRHLAKILKDEDFSEIDTYKEKDLHSFI